MFNNSFLNSIEYNSGHSVFSLPPFAQFSRSVGLFYLTGSIVGLIQMLIYKGNYGNTAAYLADVSAMMGFLYFLGNKLIGIINTIKIIK